MSEKRCGNCESWRILDPANVTEDTSCTCKSKPAREEVGTRFHPKFTFYCRHWKDKRKRGECIHWAAADRMGCCLPGYATCPCESWKAKLKDNVREKVARHLFRAWAKKWKTLVGYEASYEMINDRFRNEFFIDADKLLAIVQGGKDENCCHTE